MKIKLRAWALLATGLLHLAMLAWIISPPRHPSTGVAQPQQLRSLVSLHIVPARPRTEPPTQAAPAARPTTSQTEQAPPVLQIARSVVAPLEIITSSPAVASEPMPAAPSRPTAIILAASTAAAPEPVSQTAYQPARPPSRDCAERGMARHYPPLLRERGIEGRVLLQVRVDEQGQPAEIRVADGSGWRLLDEAARLLTQGCRFVPARRGEQTLASWIEYPVRFALNDATQ